MSIADKSDDGAEIPANGESKPDTEKKEKKGPPAHEVILDETIMRSAKLIWDGECAYAVTKEPVRALKVGTGAYRRWMTMTGRKWQEKDGKTSRLLSPPSREQFLRAEAALEATAESRGGVQEPPSIRVAGDEDNIYIDLGGDDWKCVHVTAEGWNIEPHPVGGPYMYRPKRMGTLPEPVRDGDIRELWNFITLAGRDEQVLLVADMVQMLSPKGPYPVLTFFGPQGSAKTTAQEMVMSLVDPSITSPDKNALTSLREPPRDQRSVVASARNSRVIGWDNVSYLSPEMADTICRLASGAEMGGRELYSDAEEAIVNVCRPVMLNGIPEVVSQGDLADRNIKIECRPLAERKEEEEIWPEFAEARPGILGALLDLLVLAIKNRNAKLPAGLPDVRMADFARIGESIGPALGLEPGDFTWAYHANRTNAVREIAELDSLTPRLRAFLDLQSEKRWVGSIGEMREALITGQLDRGSGWWSSAKALQTHLGRQETPLKSVGIEFAKHEKRGRSPQSGTVATLYHFGFIPPDDPADD